MPKHTNPDKVKYGPEHIDQGLRWLHKYRDNEIQQGRNPFGAPTLAQPQKASAAQAEQPKEVQNSYCLKCRKSVDHEVDAEKEMPNGALRKSGSCPYCGTAVHKFHSKKAAS